VAAGIGVIVFLFVPVLIGGIVATVGGNYWLRRAAVAEGRAPGEISFRAGTGRYVIALSAKPDGTLFDGLFRSERRAQYRVFEGDSSHARCTVTHPDGSTSSIRGDRQASSVTAGSVYETVGEFTGKGGTTTVACRFDPVEDLLGTPTEAPLMVHPANRVAQYLGIGLILGSLLVAGAGTLLILWGTAWRRART
jgi:hypothetical protein